MTTSTPTLPPLAPRAAFRFPCSETYFATGQAGLSPIFLPDSYVAYLGDRQKGLVAKRFYDAVATEVRQALTVLTKSRECTVAFLANASSALNILADAMELSAGDGVLLDSAEYISAAAPWQLLQTRGIKLHILPHPFTLIDLRSRLDDRIKVLCLSHVSYLTGYRYDLKAIRDALDGAPVRFIVDASQSLGAVPVDVDFTDATVACSHKWLVGPHGVGLLFWNHKRWPDVAPHSYGWHSVDEVEVAPALIPPYRAGSRRFEAGCLPFAELYGLRDALSYLERLSDSAITAHILQLGSYVLDELASLNLHSLTPNSPSQRGGNICFMHPHAKVIAEELAKRGIQVVGGAGRVRISLHLYNGSDDVDHLISNLKEIVSNDAIDC